MQAPEVFRGLLEAPTRPEQQRHDHREGLHQVPQGKLHTRRAWQRLLRRPNGQREQHALGQRGEDPERQKPMKAYRKPHLKGQLKALKGRLNTYKTH